MEPPAKQHPPTHKPGDAYCANCGYILTGLTDASRCPECGKPLVEVLTRVPPALRARSVRFRSETTLFGIPVIDIALGPDPERGETRGMAKGIIALGDIAVGGIAIGGISMGIVCVGGLGAGVCTIGGASLGVLTALGGFAVGGFAVGGGAIGGVAAGGVGLGVVAQGGAAVGIYARGGTPVGVYRISMTRADPEAVRVFDALTPLLGSNAGGSLIQRTWGLFSNVSITMLLALSVVLVAIFRLWTQRRRRERGETFSRGGAPP